MWDGCCWRARSCGCCCAAEMSSQSSPVRQPAAILRRRPLAGLSDRAAVGLLAILGVALAVRLYGLTYHSLWFDEVMSTVWASRSAQQIWQVGMTLVQDKHPPLYYLLLHFWTMLFGPGDAAVRALGVLLGALAVLPAFGIGTILGGWRAGLIGALFVAINPFLVWYSQEARMFMPATTFVLVGLYGTLREWRASPRGSVERLPGAGAAAAGNGTMGSLAVSAVLIVAGFSAALYSYLFSALILPVALVWALLFWLAAVRSGTRDGRATRTFVMNLASIGVVILLFLPLARAAWSVSGQESLPGRAFAGLAPALGRLLQVYSVGWPSWPGSVVSSAAIGAGLLGLLGLAVPLVGREGRWGGAFLAAWLALPVVLGGALLARDRTVFSETRYFILLIPALCLAWGRALDWLWQRWRPAGLLGLALVLGLTLAALPSDWSPGNRREAWREAATLIESLAGPNDAVVVQPDYVYPALTRYLPASRPIYYPFTHQLDDPGEVDAPLQGLRDYDVVWLVQSHHEELDPKGLVAGWFGARYPLMTEAYPAGISLHAFVQSYRNPDPPAGISRMNEALGGLLLVGCKAQPASLKARDDLYHPPSGWVHVITYWTATAPVSGDFYPQVRLQDAAGQVWGESLERQSDAIHIWPTSRWQPGEVVRLDYDVNLNPITPPGSYRITIGAPPGAAQASCGDVSVEK
jgi:4-amino-4-deoxy-L-arabinose transferase-like glycosyltransferase